MQRPTPHTVCSSLEHGSARTAVVAIGLSLLACCSGNRNESINRNLDSMRDDAGDARVAANDAEGPEPSDAEQPEPSDAEEPSLDGETDAAQAQLDASDDMDAGGSAAAFDAAESTDAGMDAAQLDAELDASEMDASDAALLDADDGDATDAGDATAECDAAALGSRIEIVRDTATNPERVTSLRWRNDAGTFTANLVGESAGGCNAASEIFGHALAWPEGRTPLLVGGLTRGTMTSCGLDTTVSTSGNNCSNMAQVPVTTNTRLFGDARATVMRISRTFGFSATTPMYTATLELAYVPRVKLSLFPTVIYPNQAGTGVTVVAASMCGGGCAVSVGTNASNTTWNGAWFADVNTTTGLALIVLRDPSMTSPVQLVHNWDAFSSSNLTAFGLVQPTGGWKEPLTEVEYLCFADFESWPQAMRDAAQLPTWCVPD
jgi:hypothetical protein